MQVGKANDPMIDPPPYQSTGCYFMDEDDNCDKGFNNGKCVVVHDGAFCEYYNIGGINGNYDCS